MTGEFVFDADVLARCERHRMPGPKAPYADLPPDERDRRWTADRLHRACLRDQELRALHEAFAASHGWRLTELPYALGALAFRSKHRAEWGELLPPLPALEESALAVVWMRPPGPGGGVPAAALLHTLLPQRVVIEARTRLAALGAATEVLPFSFLNPRMATALLIRAMVSVL
jgi:hypothetical protein